jgi:cytochrome c556
MKSFIVILLSVLMSLNVFAQEALHNSLEELMKQMGENFKAILVKMAEVRKAGHDLFK